MADIAFADLCLDQNRVQRQDGGNRGTGLHPFAQFHIHRIHQPAKRRFQFQPVHGGARQRQFRLGGIAGGAGTGQFDLGRIATVKQPLRHGKFAFALRQGDFRYAGARHGFRPLQRQHHGVCGDGIAFGQRQLVDDPVGTGRQNRVLVGCG